MKKVLTASLPLGVLQESLREHLSSENVNQINNELGIKLGDEPDFWYRHRILSKLESLARGVTFGVAAEFITYGWPFVTEHYKELIDKPVLGIFYLVIVLVARAKAYNYFNEFRIYSENIEKKLVECIEEIDRE